MPGTSPICLAHATGPRPPAKSSPLAPRQALAHFYAWLERTVAHDGRPLTEVEIEDKLRGFRAAQPGFIDLSFPTICGVGANGAIIHYNPLNAPEPATMDGSALVLLDSGGQYTCGTTDVTRTFHLGTPSDWERECFTRVLKGNIGLDSAVFPEGTPGPAIDAFARAVSTPGQAACLQPPAVAARCCAWRPASVHCCCTPVRVVVLLHTRSCAAAVHPLMTCCNEGAHE